jgi:hypothetical protein
VTPDHERLARLLKGNPQGLTRAELTHRLRMSDRAVRALIEDTVASGALPIINDRTHGGEGRYRIPRADEVDAVNAEHAELYSRAIALHKRSRGLLNGFQTHYGGGTLFTPASPDLEDAA